MIWFIWNAVSDFFAPLAGWTGFLALIAGGAVVVGLYVPSTARLAWPIAVGAGFGALMYWMGDHNGTDRINARWRQSLEAEWQNGEQARSDAEHTTARDTPDIVRRDPRNRDNWGSKPQSGAKSPVRGLAGP